MQLKTLKKKDNKCKSESELILDPLKISLLRNWCKNQIQIEGCALVLFSMVSICGGLGTTCRPRETNEIDVKKKTTRQT